jgi:hypothetical protein
MNENELLKAPKGKYVSEVIVNGKQFFGQAEYPLLSHAQAAKSATNFLNSSSFTPTAPTPQH